MKQSKIMMMLLAVAISATASAVSLPREIFKPAGAKVIKSERQADGEFEAKFLVRSNNVSHLVKQTIAHAKRHGFHLVESEIESEIEGDDVDLKFRRGEYQELDVSIEKKGRNHIEYKADLDLEHN